MEQERGKRLFLAICFPEEVKTELSDRAALLREGAFKGNFTRRENFHLTLAFLGQTGRQREVERLMERLNFPNFSLTLAGFGRFRGKQGDVWWMGVKENGMLSALQSLLQRELLELGFTLDRRAYRPHVTLGRGVVLSSRTAGEDALGPLPPIDVPVREFVLMESKRDDGTLRYIPLFSRALQSGENE